MKLAEDLRKSVLQAAMQGLITKTEANDSSVDELVTKLIFDPKLGDVTEEEIPHDIPETWKWIRIGNLGKSCDTKSFSDGPFGSNLKKEHQILQPEVRIIQLSNIGKDGWRNENEKYTSYQHLTTIARCEVKPGDFVIAKMMPAGRAIIVPDLKTKICLGSDAVKFVANDILNKDYLLYALRSASFLNQVYGEVHGITRVRTSLNKLKTYVLPIPPIEEQQRIVEKLNTILPLIDELTIYGTNKKVGRPKQEEALAFISSLLGPKKSTESKPVNPEISELTSKAKEELPAVVKKYANLMGVIYNCITIRHQKTRWGSCTKTGNLSFNCLIMKMPETVRDYVIVHELAHRKELNHSTKFWTIVAEYCPWYKDAKQWLKDNGQELMEI